jgi:PDZ domain-containing protein
MRRTDQSEREDVPLGRPRRPRKWKMVLIAAGAAAFIVAAFSVPIPIIFGYLPGPVENVEELVAVSGATTYSSEGSLYLTTVSVDPQVTLVEWIAMVVDPTKAVVSKEEVTGGQSLDDLQRQQEQQMTDSKRDAEVVAISALGLANPSGDGAFVEGTVADQPADGVLREGDVIVSVNDEDTATLCDVGREIGEQDPGDEVRVQVLRDDRRVSLTLTAAENPTIPGRAYLGVAMRPEYEFDPGLDVDFKTRDIAGPSAGLMFALGLYDMLTPEDLTDGRQVAGTGVIGCDGSVQPIGGVEQKIAGAERRGAEIFLSPKANAAAARTATEDVEVVAVETFDEAVTYLESLE